MEALDGNAIGGVLWDVFGHDMTTSQVECGRCGAGGPLAECEVYLGGPGIIVRCRGCRGQLMVFVEVRERMCVDLFGVCGLANPSR